MNLNRIRHEIKYAYARMEAFNEYYDVNSLLLETAVNKVLDEGEILADIEENGATGVQRSMKKLSDYIIGNRRLVNGLRSEEKVLPLKAVEILEGVKPQNRAGIIYVSFPLDGQFNIIVKKQRGALFKADGMYIKPYAHSFQLINPLLIYGHEDYSIALSSPDNQFGFALMYGPSLIGAKGQNMLKVSYFDQEAYYVDDAAKYREVSDFGIF
ncbi:hypothetical protein SAMN02745221_00212 [Thermosyntropha lipolytica DSM 11003]|uniref:Uncharacterized protein n=1 Tax=Thermosyntropha lipolytica DSM 11003 TaxID=1123382 RepID=A0A1M5JSP2_9FIRM|nr:hypothetical protein [Thermosyntropha lipolytica]SHG43554.1 hypothetical protein SAMN02745221_00212 [Thermosyntropha lipolytica DSM 11003]